MTGMISIALMLIVFGGIMEGSFALPMRWTKDWAWENVWLIYSIVSLLVVPWCAVVLVIPHVLLLYQSIPASTIAATMLFGLCWGIANVLFGVALPLVGMATAFAVIVGMSAALGSLIPLAISDRHEITGMSGMLVLAGVALTLAGVVLIGVAGRAREKDNLESSKINSVFKGKAVLGLTLCGVAGLLAPMLNFSFAFGSAISRQAVLQGASTTQAANAIWAISLAGGFVSNGGYSTMLLFKHHTWSRLIVAKTMRNYWLAASMGILWTMGVLFYGWGARGLGTLGASIGWPVFQSTMILVSSIAGIITGEWKNSKPRTIVLNACGLGILLIAIVVLGAVRH